MDSIMDLMRARHSVRQYTDKPIPPELRAELDACAAELNRQGDLRIQILYDEPDCFNSRRAHYGKFENCANYIALVGKKAPDLEERCGYFGEKLVLKAQELGLNSCWVALTHGKSKAVKARGETEVILIALGYGKTQGSPRKSKTAAEVSNLDADAPYWFRRGVEAALLAPTAVNQQRFQITRDGRKVSIKAGLIGPCLQIDLGIVKCHFALAAGTGSFTWTDNERR